MPLDPPPDPSDEFLITSMLGGDEAALNKLIQRFDRLVRYTILGAARDRCLHDPQWLDSMASATWAGFVRSVQRYPDRRPRSLPAYLAAIAKYQVLGAIRGAPTPGETPLSVEHLDSDIAATTEEPSEILSELELLETVRACLSELGDDDRTLAGQLTAITERRWRDAAAALGISESTLRSRWKRTLDRLRTCVEGKTGLRLAPNRLNDDYLG